MIDRWLGEMTRSAFEREFLSRQALALPGTAFDTARLFDWSKFDETLGNGPLDALVVARGEIVPWAQPRSLAELRGYFARGVGLAVRRGERHHPLLARVAHEFDVALGPAHVQVFATPGGTHGYSWHYDDEDVFIAQTVGVKEYFFRPNTVASDLPAHSSVFPRIERESSPLYTARLLPGDFLYLPARWWHVALCEEDALSLSVGVYPRRARAQVHAR